MTGTDRQTARLLISNFQSNDGRFDQTSITSLIIISVPAVTKHTRSWRYGWRQSNDRICPLTSLPRKRPAPSFPKPCLPQVTWGSTAIRSCQQRLGEPKKREGGAASSRPTSTHKNEDGLYRHNTLISARGKLAVSSSRFSFFLLLPLSVPPLPLVTEAGMWRQTRWHPPRNAYRADRGSKNSSRQCTNNKSSFFSKTLKCLLQRSPLSAGFKSGNTEPGKEVTDNDDGDADDFLLFVFSFL